MMKVRKKPVIVEAFQTDQVIFIDTLEGRMKAEKGDWIITGVNREQYPCKPDIFDKTYEVVGDEDDSQLTAEEIDWIDLFLNCGVLGDTDRSILKKLQKQKEMLKDEKIIY